MIAFLAAATLLSVPVNNVAASSVTAHKDLGDAGRLIIPSLNVNEAQLDDVLVALAQFSGLNIITGAKVSGNVSVYWQNVTVQEALEALLETNDLGYIYKNGIVRVLDAKRLGEDQVILVTRVFQLDYLSAREVAQSLGDTTSDKGRIQVNQESNSLVVTDRAERITEIARIIEEMDTRFLQVLIEAQLWEVSFGDDTNLGIDWSVVGRDPTDRLDINLGNAATAAVNSVLPGGSLQLGFVRDSQTFTGFLNALQQTSDVKILAHPYILARNNKEADIRLQDQLPFVETSISNGVITESIQYQEVGIRLTVTPQITNDDHVILDVLVSQRIPGPPVTLQNSVAFSVDERVESTTLIVPDTKTVVIGGLFRTNASYAMDKVPLLGDLPIFGHFFRKKSVTERRTDLMLCMTPHIIRDHEVLSDQVASRLDQFEDERQQLANQLETLNQREASRRGGIKDKILDETSDNLGPVLLGSDKFPADPKLKPALPREIHGLPAGDVEPEIETQPSQEVIEYLPADEVAE